MDGGEGGCDGRPQDPCMRIRCDCKLLDKLSKVQLMERERSVMMWKDS